MVTQGNKKCPIRQGNLSEGIFPGAQVTNRRVTGISENTLSGVTKTGVEILDMTG